jgi:cytochrome b involved in lipid metabolism
MGKMALGEHVDPWVAESGMETTVRIESAVHVLIYASFLFGAILDTNIRAFVIWYWLMPHILGAGHLRWYQFAEHRACESGTYTDLDAWGSARTTSTWWFYCQLAWNMPYHIEHHAWPAVPFHLLPEIHQRIKDSQPKNRCLISGDSGYTGIHYEFLKRVMGGKPTGLPPVEAKDKSEEEKEEVEGSANRLGDAEAMAKLPRFTLEDIQKHKTKDDCWLAVMGVVVNVSSFLADHPGGETILLNQAGKDATKMFKMIHPERTLERQLPDECIVGTLAEASTSNLNEPLLNKASGDS